MEPEIDRRCPECGAAVRPQAAFCQQCGRAMKASAGDQKSALASTMESVESTPPEKRDGEEASKRTRPLAVTAASSRPNEPPPPSSAPATPPSAASTAPSNPEPVSLPAQVAREQIASGKVIEPAPEPKERRRGQRVAAVARDVVEERLAPRVEKLRQASNVVWGEAQDDPNLRFILIAVFLFIIAMVIILLGTYLR